MVIKHADVDIQIQPIVKWLNSFDGIYTRWSCQGDPSKPFDKETEVNGVVCVDPAVPAYVSFYCESAIDLAHVLNISDVYAHTEVKFYPASGGLRYVMRFNPLAKTLSLEEFVKMLRLKGEIE
jgi:hypothetical protein